MDQEELTQSLEIDAMTANLLGRLAAKWGISVEEAVRRAITQANAENGSQNKEGRLEVFKELQERLNLTPAKVAEWQDAVRNARRR
jgi:hypothetical protein